ncbi:TRAP transporter substrate-binding protein DctP, partial [Chloroflexota bacterium]
RQGPAQGFYIMTNKKVEEPYSGFQGLKIRSVATYARFLDALGCARVTVPRTDIYSALERGVIDAFIGNVSVTADLGQHEILKYMIDHKFYQSNVVIWMNLDTWNKLDAHLQKLLVDTMAEHEKWDDTFWVSTEQESRQKFVDVGVEFLKFSPGDAQWFLDLAYKSVIDEFLEASPEIGPKLLEVMGY